MIGHNKDKQDELSLIDAEALDNALLHLAQDELDELLGLLCEDEAPPYGKTEPFDQLVSFDWQEWSELLASSGQPVPDMPPYASPETDVRPDPSVQPALLDRLAQSVHGDRFGSELYEWVRALVSAIICVGILSVFVVRIIGVTGDSMNPTLENGQRLLLSNIFYRPAPGDIVIFAERYALNGINRAERNEPLVKRVIAVEGQTVDIHFDAGEVWVDNILQQEPYIADLTHRPGDLIFPLTVPPGCIFAMGDNRNDSFDSRWSQVGMIDERCVLGRVLLRLWPPGLLGQVS